MLKSQSDKKINPKLAQEYFKTARVFESNAAILYKQDDDDGAKKQLTKAIQYYEAAIKFNPNHYGANFNLGQIFLEEDEEKAIQCFLKALQTAPKNEISNIYLALAMAYYHLKNKNEVINYSILAIKANPNTKLHIKNLFQKNQEIWSKIEPNEYAKFFLTAEKIETDNIAKRSNTQSIML